jgi:hypothetical protein
MTPAEHVFVAMCSILFAIVIFGWYTIIKVGCGLFSNIDFKKTAFGGFLRQGSWFFLFLAVIMFFTRG